MVYTPYFACHFSSYERHKLTAHHRRRSRRQPTRRAGKRRRRSQPPSCEYRKVRKTPSKAQHYVVPFIADLHPCAQISQSYPSAPRCELCFPTLTTSSTSSLSSSPTRACTREGGLHSTSPSTRTFHMIPRRFYVRRRSTILTSISRARCA